MSAGFSQISDAIKAGRLRESLSFLGGIRNTGVNTSLLDIPRLFLEARLSRLDASDELLLTTRIGHSSEINCPMHQQ